MSKELTERKKKVLVISNCFSQRSLLISSIKYSQTRKMHQSGGKKTVVIRQILPYVSIIQQFQIQIRKFQNLLNMELRKKLNACIFQMK